MAESETYRKGAEMRRQLLGDAFVERAARTTYNDPIMRKFIDVATETVFGALWTRPGLDLKTRTLACVVSDAATGRFPELAIHVRMALRQGWTPDELTEVLLHISGYVGVPIIREALLTAKEVFAEVGGATSAADPTTARRQSVVTPERFASGMSFDQYVKYVGSPENLKREGSGGAARRDWSDHLRTTYATTRLTDDQIAAWKWLATQPNGPAKVLVIAEEWSSDCRRDLPVVARVADAAALELRILRRDGQRASTSHRPTLAEAPDSNADIMAEFLNEKNGQTWQSIPVIVFYTRGFEYLYHYTEYPAIYHKDRLVAGHIRAARPGETAEQTQERGTREFLALQASPFFRVWACAAVDEMLSALHERVVLGPGA
jgi:4-carboxymuconolactone decarboxylase